MRLQLIAASLVACGTVACGPASVAAQDTSSVARLRGAAYQDDDETTVVTSSVRAAAEIEGAVRLRAGYLLDVVTTASVDVVAAATQRWDELRHQGDGGIDVRFDDVSLSGGYRHSAEHDWWSHRGQLGMTVDLADRATTLGVGLSFVHSDVGRQQDPTFHAEQQIYGGTVSLAQVVDPETLVQVGYSIAQVEGYQASPYRYVAVGQGAYLPERHPRSRSRHALAGRLRRALGDDVVLRVGERLYLDDWGLFATTTDLALAFRAGDVVEIEVRDRFHFQSAASFYQERYDAPRTFVSVDRELSTMLDNYVGAALILTSDGPAPFRWFRFDLRADLFYYHFFDYTRLAGRIGALTSLGLEAAF